MLNIDIDVECH